MAYYQLMKANECDAAYLKKVFPRIADLSEDNQRLVLDAYATVWKNSDFRTLEEIRFSAHSEHYSLVDHINEVAEFSLLLADQAKKAWEDSYTAQFEREDVILLALVHDLDKVMLLSQACVEAELPKKISHGYLSGMILHDLGAPSRIVSLVSYHSPSACMHLYDPLAMILHYADLFSADHIYMLAGRKPFYFE